MGHQALAHALQDWDARTAELREVMWGGSINRKSKIYLAAMIVDHPQLDKHTASGTS